MGQFEEEFPPTANADDFDSLLLNEFQQAWQEVVERIALPDLAAFQNRAQAFGCSHLSPRLQDLDSEYRSRLAKEPQSQLPGLSALDQERAGENTIVGPPPIEDSEGFVVADEGQYLLETPAGALPGTAAWVPLEDSEEDASKPAFAPTIIGPPPIEDSEGFIVAGEGEYILETPGGALPGTAAWVSQEEPEDAASTPAFAPTIVGNTDQGKNAPTDGAGGTASSKQPIVVRVAGYEILGTLGRGGMGVVYRARQVGLNRFVALKMILNGKHVAPEVLDRFRAEAEAVAQLQHQNIVQIYDIGTHDGLPFFSLELVEGESLAAAQDNQPMPANRSAAIIETLARAMHYAHVRGIVHRDLKPANVLLTTEGVPKVTDFGLVKRLEDDKDSVQTRAGTIMGTPSYMAPEQAWGSEDVGPLADVYSLGATLYALLTGRPPFMGPTPAETVLLLRHQEPVPPSRLQPNLPRDLETICLKCLQKEPEKRYANAEDFAEDLRRFQAGEPVLARPVGRSERLWRWCRRNPALAVSGGIAIALAIFLMIGGPLAALVINRERETAITAQGLAEKNEKQAALNAGLAREQRDFALIAIETLVERSAHPTEKRARHGFHQEKPAADGDGWLEQNRRCGRQGKQRFRLRQGPRENGRSAAGSRRDPIRSEAIPAQPCDFISACQNRNGNRKGRPLSPIGPFVPQSGKSRRTLGRRTGGERFLPRFFEGPRSGAAHRR